MESTVLQLLIAFTFGILFWPLLRIVFARLLRSSLFTGDGSSSIYGLEHGVLNLELPLSMWMNVGYWKDQIDRPRGFSQACRALLELVLQSAFEYSDPIGRVPERICLVDVGFGCGDQSLFLLNPACREEASSNELNNTGVRAGWPAVEMYVGLTNNPTQYAYAHRRLESANALDGSRKDRRSDKVGTAYTKWTMYCDDAATPSLWSPELMESMERVRERSKKLPVWLLALDTMYHFKPSRFLLLKYALAELNSSFMAFDFLLADGKNAPTTLQRLLLRLVCLLTSAPYSNFLTQTQYEQMLLNAGYAAENIEIDDITDYVFKPLSEYMAWKDVQLQSIGIGIGAFRVAKWIFSWWGRSGIVRGCIVVARKKHA
jgi:hypothetical protein